MPPPPTRPAPSAVTPTATTGKPSLPPQPKPPSAAPARQPAKTFSVVTQSSKNEGLRVLIYGNSGMGKTTLGNLFPDPVFLALDDGSKHLGAKAITGVETYQDTRDAIAQAINLIPAKGSLVIDTITKLEALIEPHILATVKTEKGSTPTSLLQYGWGGGYRHMLEHMRLILADLDNLIRSGRNVVILAQEAAARIANLEGADYLQSGPQLYSSANANLRSEVCAWCDHVIRVGYPDIVVVKDNVQNRTGKVSGSTVRSLFTAAPLHFIAKSRPVDGKQLPEVISFESPTDNSLIQMLFHGGIP